MLVESIYLSCPFTIWNGNTHRVHLPFKLESARLVYLPFGLESNRQVHLPFEMEMPLGSIYLLGWKVPIESIYPSGSIYLLKWKVTVGSIYPSNSIYPSRWKCLLDPFCKIEFNQPSCWIYSVPNLLVFQQLVTLYLGENHVRIVCERVKKCLSLCKVAGTCDCTSRVARGLQAARNCTRAKHMEKLKCHASWSTTRQKVQTSHSISSRLNLQLSQVARPNRQPALFWKN